jgi:hypothetical protein
LIDAQHHPGVLKKTTYLADVRVPGVPASPVASLLGLRRRIGTGSLNGRRHVTPEIFQIVLGSDPALPNETHHLPQ